MFTVCPVCKWEDCRCPVLTAQHQFSSELESRAFALGFAMAQNHGIGIEVDTLQPQTVNFTFDEDRNECPEDALKHFENVIAWHETPAEDRPTLPPQDMASAAPAVSDSTICPHGNWMITTDNRGAIPEHFRQLIITDETGHQEICRLPEGQTRATQSPYLANRAKLLASAPALARACRSMARQDIGGNIPWIHSAAVTTDIEKLRAIAIAYSKTWNDEVMPALHRAGCVYQP